MVLSQVVVVVVEVAADLPEAKVVVVRAVKQDQVLITVP
jgi:hypothetical protein